MTYPIRFWAVVLIILLAFQLTSEASADWCKFEKDIDLTLDVADSQSLAITAGAGALEIIGVSGTDEAVISGKVCASKEEWLEESTIETETGKRASVAVELPNASGWSFTGSTYVSMDLKVEVPENLPLDVKDSSGEMFLKNIAAVEIKDSSGEIEIEDARGAITINDSSGDIDIEGVNGDVTIESDSSGSIYAEDVDGSFLVIRDSSGDIRVTGVSKDVVVERDSSGDIRATDVRGDFRVLKDGSGEIVAKNVEGEIDIPSED